MPPVSFVLLNRPHGGNVVQPEFRDSNMSSRSFVFSLLLSTALLGHPALAGVVGQNVPSQPLNVERTAGLPLKSRAAWADYIARSQAQMQADKASLAAERTNLAAIPAPPAEGNGDKSMPLKNPPEWYAGPEARHVADVIVSFQTPAGGWGKNTPRDGAVRLPGQSYVSDNLSRLPSPGDLDTPADVHWNYVGTIDNGATTTELRFLAKVAAAAPGNEGDAWRTSFLRGVDYLLAAQFPNGGWPQVWPLQGGYHDDITFNDDALSDVASLLADVAGGRNEFAFVPAVARANAMQAEAHAVDCILKTQVHIGGKLTVWGQQHDALTLAPGSARNFEPPALSSSESAGLLVYLMKIKNPSPDIAASVHTGVAWLQANALHDVAFTKVDGNRQLVATPGAPLLWARYYSLTTGKPVFGDRDKSVHDDVQDLTAERRNGYSWYNTTPQKALDAYAKWSQAHPK